MGLKGFLFFLLRVAVALGILFYLLKKIPLSRVIDSLFSVNLGFVFSAFLASILLQLVLAYRLRLLTEKQKINISTFDLLCINLSAVFYGLFLPGGNLTGGVVRFYKLSGLSDSRGGVLVAMVFDRVVATVTLCVIGVVFWLLDFSNLRTVSIIAFMGGLFFLVCTGFFSRKVISFNRRWEKVSLVPKRFGSLYLSLSRYRHASPGFIFLVVFISLFAQLFGVLIYYVLAASLKLELSFVTIGWIRSAVVFATMFPVSFSGLGIREGVLIALLKPFEVPEKEALALSFLIFCITLLLIGIIGGVLEGKRFLFNRTDYL
jgi:uncharacterized protein (TIRG00374 family)